jgi:hypothetical protein
VLPLLALEPVGRGVEVADRVEEPRVPALSIEPLRAAQREGAAEGEVVIADALGGHRREHCLAHPIVVQLDVVVGRRARAPHEVAAAQRPERAEHALGRDARRGERHREGDGAVRHREHLDQGSLGARQRLHSPGEHPLERDSLRRSRCSRRSRLSLLRCIAGELQHEERHPPRLGRDRRRQPVLRDLERRERLAREPLGVRLRKGAHLDGEQLDITPLAPLAQAAGGLEVWRERRAGRRLVRAERERAQQPPRRGRCKQRQQHRGAVGVGPLEVVDGQHERMLGGERREQLAQRLDRPPTHLEQRDARGASRVVSQARGDRRHAREHREDPRELAYPGRHRAEEGLGSPRRQAHGKLVEHSIERLVGDRLALVAAPPQRQRPVPGTGLVEQARQQGRLAHPGGARQVYHGRAPAGRPRERPAEERPLLASPEQPRLRRPHAHRLALARPRGDRHQRLTRGPPARLGVEQRGRQRREIFRCFLEDIRRRRHPQPLGVPERRLPAPRERRDAGEGQVENEPDRVPVGSLAHARPEVLLGCHPRRRPRGRGAQLEPAVDGGAALPAAAAPRRVCLFARIARGGLAHPRLDQPRGDARQRLDAHVRPRGQAPGRAHQPEIDHHHAPGLIDQHVARLDVEVKQPGAMKRVDPAHQLRQRRPQLRHRGRRRGPLVPLGPAQPGDEVDALDALHREEPEIVVAAQLVERDKVRVRQIRHHAELRLEPEQPLGVEVRQRLQRHPRPVVAIDGVVDRTHPPRAQHARHVVPPHAHRSLQCRRAQVLGRHAPSPLIAAPRRRAGSSVTSPGKSRSRPRPSGASA